MSTTATNALSQMREGTNILGANVAKAPAYGASEDRVLFLPGQGRKASIAAPVLSVQSTMHIKHTFSATGFDGDLFVDSVDGSSNGVGMLLVKTREGATVLTTNTSFTLNKNNELVNSNGAKLLGYIPNADGSLPANSADISKLQSMDLTRATSRAEATTKIGLRLNLKATQKAMQGPGSTVILSAFGAAKASTNKAIITPGENTNALLLEGDVLTLKSTAKGTAPVAIVPTYSFHFKGFATSREVTDTNNLYSATSPSKPFNVNPQGVAGDNTHLAFGQGIKINVGGADGSNFEFKATQASNESHLGNFNSLQSLADAINRTSGGLIRATIGSDNRLRIAPKNANHAMSFEDLNAPGGAVKGLVQQLGLQNQAAKADNVFIEYYASLEELSLKINSKEGLSSEVLNNGQIRFGADVATSSLNANGETSNARIFQRAYSGGIAGIDNTMDANLRNLVTIESPNHGLKVGDYVRLEGGPATLTPGMYRVNAVTGDSFVVASTGGLTARNAGAPALGTNLLAAPVAGAAAATTWRKLEGAFNDDGVTGLPPAAGTPVTIPAVDGNGDNAVVITLAAVNPTDQMAIGDMVYITGSNLLKDGYYKVSNVGGGGADITVLTRQALDLKPAGVGAVGGAAQADGNLRMIKVSQLNGALEPLPIELTNGTKDVKISVPAGHNYAKGDFIKFTNLATDKVTFQGIEINKDKAYIIKEVTAGLNGSSKITFEADGAVATGNGLIGYANTQNNAGAIANAANTILGVDAKINHISKLFKGFGITTTQEYFNGLQPTYDAIQSTKNLADNPDRAHYSRPVTIYDSLGVSHTVMIGFVKLKENLWAAEVSVPQRPDGTYEVSGDHKITYGDISFDGNGQLYNPEEALTKDLTFSWNNGASPSTIKIDFGALIGTGDTGNVGLTQIAGDYDTKQIDTDGNPPGNLMGWYIRDDGSFVAKFDNSTEQVVGKIAVGHIPVLGELTDLGKGEYTTNSKSGDLILKTGIILSGGLAASDIDQTTKTIEMSQLATHQQFVARTLSVQRDVEQDLLRQLG